MYKQRMFLLWIYHKFDNWFQTEGFLVMANFMYGFFAICSAIAFVTFFVDIVFSGNEFDNFILRESVYWDMWRIFFYPTGLIGLLIWILRMIYFAVVSVIKKVAVAKYEFDNSLSALNKDFTSFMVEGPKKKKKQLRTSYPDLNESNPSDYIDEFGHFDMESFNKDFTEELDNEYKSVYRSTSENDLNK